MDIYLKMVGMTAVGIMLSLVLSRNSKDYSFLIAVVICCGLCISAVSFLAPIFDFLTDLEGWIGKTAPLMEVLIKAVGLSLIGETMVTICADAGHAAVGKTLQLCTTVGIIYIGIPLVKSLFELIESVLEML